MRNSDLYPLSKFKIGDSVITYKFEDYFSEEKPNIRLKGFIININSIINHYMIHKNDKLFFHESAISSCKMVLIEKTLNLDGIYV